MPRFVLSHRLAGKRRDHERRSSRRMARRALRLLSPGISRIYDHEPDDPAERRLTVFDGEAAEVAAKARTTHSDVLIERVISHGPHLAGFLHRGARPLPEHAGRGHRLHVRVYGNRKPLSGAEVVLLLEDRHGTQTRVMQLTGPEGRVTFTFGRTLRCLQAIAAPAAAFWSAHARPRGETVSINCPPLPQSGPLGWWHRLLGVSTYEKRRGQGIRIGVADTGLGVHPNLSHVRNLGAAIQGRIDPAAGADCGSHGTHVCGILGSRPHRAGDFAGFAPGADIFSVRVFTQDTETTQADIVLGLEELVRHDTDLVNLSLGSAEPSKILHDALRSAFERGTLCLCSAGNTSSAVDWPAAFKETVGVTALGRIGWGPPQSTARACAPRDFNLFARHDTFFANFSCFGGGVTCAGPGVGIISTVPALPGLPAPYASMDGTSLASPAVCGALAAILSRKRSWRALPRNETRAHTARLILERTCRDAGLDMRHQGVGVVWTGK